MSTGAPTLPPSMEIFLEGFQAVERQIRLYEEDTTFLPVEVPGPDVAHALGAYLTSAGRPVVTIEPRDDGEAWRGLPAAIYNAKPAPKRVVMVIGMERPPREILAGLHLLNQRRDTLWGHLQCPLLLCGPVSFMRLLMEKTPDFWSFTSIMVRLSPYLTKAAEGADALLPSRMSAASLSPLSKERLSLYQMAKDQGDVPMAARAAARLAESLMADDALDEAAEVLAEAGASSFVRSGAPSHVLDLAYQRAMLERRKGKATSAAATLGALVTQPELSSYLRVKAHLALGGALADAGDVAESEAAYREALKLAEESGDQETQAKALIGTYSLVARAGRAAEAEEPLQRALAIAERLNLPELLSSAKAALALLASASFDAQASTALVNEAKALRPSAERKAGFEQGPWDVLILTALHDELVGLLSTTGGQEAWSVRQDLSGFRYYARHMPGDQGGSLRVAAAWIGEMGERSAAIRGGALLDELDPGCLAMCGICAGYRKTVNLGDVIIADKMFPFDEGKIEAHQGKAPVFFHTIRTFDLEAVWKMDAAYLAKELDIAAIAEKRPPGKAAQERWLLHTLYEHETGNGPSPLSHPERVKKCPNWTERLKVAVAQKLVALRGKDLKLTEAGKERVEEELVLFPDGPPKEPAMAIHVGPIAVVGAVTEDPTLFERVRVIEKNTLGAEMEGAALGELAARFKKPVILMKAVSDYADSDKDDSFRAFACEASAAVLVAFLQKHLQPKRAAAPEERLSPRRREEPRELWGKRGFEDFEDRFPDLLLKVERVTLLKDPGMTATRHRAKAPFAGVLEVFAADGSDVDVRVVAALDQPITEELVRQYLNEVEQPFRAQNPLLRSTLVHAGEQAPIALQKGAYRQGVVLRSFGEYQGKLIDFTRYAKWQMDRLKLDEQYPPWLYVDQSAKVTGPGQDSIKVQSAIDYLLDFVVAEERRFGLVLGDFGFGKTFLLRELTRRLIGQKSPIVPILIEMRTLEKTQSLRGLLSLHFGAADVGAINVDSFLYMLEQGRVALIFDGFDELAVRVTYDQVLHYFDTITGAATGNAKVIVSGRKQLFWNDKGVRQELANKAEALQSYRIVELLQFEEAHIRRFLENRLGDKKKAEARYELIDDIKDLMGLSYNPRMLSFIVDLEEEKLMEARGAGVITPAKLYELIVERWIKGESELSQVPEENLLIAVCELARTLWSTPGNAVELERLPNVLVPPLRDHKQQALPFDQARFAFGARSLLKRDAEGNFSFVHRSVLEWLVAREAAREITEGQGASVLHADRMSPLMAGFLRDLAKMEDVAAWAAKVFGAAKNEIAVHNALEVATALKLSLSVNLEGRDLRGQPLDGLNLKGAKLKGANLEGKVLDGRDLTGADLREAKLARASLKRAVLTGADLSDADLSFANLVGAILYRTKLDGAVLTATKLLHIEAEATALANTRPWGAALPHDTPSLKLAPPTGAHRCITISVNGILATAAGDEDVICLWDIASGALINILSGHTLEVNSVVFSHDGKTLASGSEDATVRLWNTASGALLKTLSSHSAGVNCVTFSHDDQILASGSDDDTVRFWNPSSGALLKTLSGQSERVSSVAFSHDDKIFTSGSDDGAVYLWDPSSGTLLKTLSAHSDSVNCVAFGPNSQPLASGSDDSTVRLWNPTSGALLKTLFGHSGYVRSVAFSHDGRTLASGSDDNTIRLWNPASGVLLNTLSEHSSSVLSVAFSHDGKTLASGSDDNTVRLWNPASGARFNTLSGHSSSVLSVAFSHDGNTLASGSSDNTVRLWNPTSGVPFSLLSEHSSSVFSVAFSHDGKTLASGSSDKTVRLWNTASGALLNKLSGHSSYVWSVAFSRDGKTLASGSSDSTIYLWKATSGALLKPLSGHFLDVWSVAFSHDGKTLASGSSDKTVRLWDPTSGALLKTLSGHSHIVWNVAFSHDGKTLASGSSDKTVRLWNTTSGALLNTLSGHSQSVRSVSFSHDGKTLASGSDDNTVRLWNTTSGALLNTLSGHSSSVRSVAFSHDGKTLASGSSDNTVRLWDVPTGRCFAILFALPTGWVAFSPITGRYKIHGDLQGSFWYLAGLCRFEPSEMEELDAYRPAGQKLHLPDDASFRDLLLASGPLLPGEPKA